MVSSNALASAGNQTFEFSVLVASQLPRFSSGSELGVDEETYSPLARLLSWMFALFGLSLVLLSLKSLAMMAGTCFLSLAFQYWFLFYSWKGANYPSDLVTSNSTASASRSPAWPQQ